MTSSRDLRAMVAGLERAMQCLRSANGSKVVEEIKKARAALENEVADAEAAQRLATRAGVDASRLSEKIIAARTLLKKSGSISGDVVVDMENSLVGGFSALATRSDAFGSTASRPENSNSHHPRAPQDEDAKSVRSSVATRNEDELRFRLEEISLRRKMEDIERAKQDLERERT